MIFTILLQLYQSRNPNNNNYIHTACSLRPPFQYRSKRLRPPKSPLNLKWRFATDSILRNLRTYDTNSGVTYERHCATNDGRNLRGSARSLPTRRAEPIDPATFPSGGELTSPPSTASSMYPHHLIHLVEPPPDWIPPNIHGSHLTNPAWCLWDSQQREKWNLRINDRRVNLAFFILLTAWEHLGNYVWTTTRREKKIRDNLRYKLI